MAAFISNQPRCQWQAAISASLQKPKCWMVHSRRLSHPQAWREQPIRNLLCRQSACRAASEPNPVNNKHKRPCDILWGLISLLTYQNIPNLFQCSTSPRFETRPARGANEKTPLWRFFICDAEESSGGTFVRTRRPCLIFCDWKETKYRQGVPFM